MNMVRYWSGIINESFTTFVEAFLAFLPSIIGALIVFLIGWLIALAVGRLIKEILIQVKLNRLFEKKGWGQSLEKADIKSDPAGFIGNIFKWLFIVLTLYIVAGILNLDGIEHVLEKLLGFVPNVAAAIFIFVVAVIIADVLEKLSRAAIEGMKVKSAHLVGVIVKWSIWIFAALMILEQLRIAPEFMTILFTGFVMMLALAMGLAFGLGGKDVVADVLESLKKNLKGKP